MGNVFWERGLPKVGAPTSIDVFQIPRLEKIMREIINRLNDLSRVARGTLLRMHQRSKTGHIGGNLSCLDLLVSVRLASFSAQDRLVLSKGHSTGALYVVLQLAGVIAEEELSSFYQNGTRLPGHPPIGLFDEIPFATGSLGHGVSLACGMALGKKLRDESGWVYCVCSDGEWQEGATWEAIGFAVSHGLDNLIILIDENGLQGFGSTREIWAGSTLRERIQGFNPHLQDASGHDHDEIQNALDAARNSSGRPHVIVCRTHKGQGVSFMRDKMEWHYLPMDPVQANQAIGEVEK